MESRRISCVKTMPLPAPPPPPAPRASCLSADDDTPSS
jgi:hypothetical protein